MFLGGAVRTYEPISHTFPSLINRAAPPSVTSSWPAPNYVDPVSRGSSLKILSIVAIVLGLLIVSLRIYARFILTKAPGVDDLAICLGLFFAIVFSTLQIVAVENLGVGRHIWDVPPSFGVAIRHNLFISQWCYIISMASIKISILLLYKRLSGAFTKAFFWASWAGIVFNILYAIGYSLMLLLECQPVAAYWISFDPAFAGDEKYHCSNIESVMLPTWASLSVLADVYSTVIPLTLVCTLQLPLRKRLSLYAFFAVGFSVAGAGIVRTWYIYHTSNKTYDTTWWLAPSLFWVTFEVYLALICACAPGLKAIFKNLLVEPIPMRVTENGVVAEQGKNVDAAEMQQQGDSWISTHAQTGKQERLSSIEYEITDPGNRHSQPEVAELHSSHNPPVAQPGRRSSQSHNSDNTDPSERRPTSFIFPF